MDEQEQKADAGDTNGRGDEADADVAGPLVTEPGAAPGGPKTPYREDSQEG